MNGPHASWGVVIFLTFSHCSYSIENGATGSIFKMGRTRTLGSFSRANLQPMNVTILRDLRCSVWAVCSTIEHPTIAMENLILDHDVCLLVVADISTPTHSYLQQFGAYPNFIYLTVEQQLSQFPGFTIPLLHFSRKNFGYLCAIANGARAIWDFDASHNFVGDGRPWNQQKTDIFVKTECHSGLFNPYQQIQHSSSTPIWPRGYPLDRIHTENNCTSESGYVSESQIGVIQVLVNSDPDVDAIYRMTNKLPVDIKFNGLIGLYPGTFMPMNSKATFFFPACFESLLLPMSVHSRVSDIWRGYILQHLLQKNTTVAVMGPIIKHDSDPLSYFHDFSAETDLYMKAGGLVDYLSKRQYFSRGTSSEFLDLYIDLYEYGIVEEEDVHLADFWLNVFHQVSQRESMPRPSEQCGFPARIPGMLHLGDVTKSLQFKDDAGGLSQCQNACCADPKCITYNFLLGMCNFTALNSDAISSSSSHACTGTIVRSSVLITGMQPSHDVLHILVIVNFHYKATLAVLEALTYQIYPNCFYPNFSSSGSVFDITFIGAAGSEAFGIMVNPYSHNGYYSYYSVNLAASRYPGYSGYLYTNDDVFLHSWNFKDVNFHHPWITHLPEPNEIGLEADPDLQGSWEWYRNPVLSRNVHRTFYEAQAQASAEIKGLRHSYNWATHTDSDVFFVSRGVFKQFESFSRACMASGCFLEIAVPTILFQISNNVSVHIICTDWDTSHRWNVDAVFKFDCIGTHPVKLSSSATLNSVGKFVDQFC